MSRIGKNPISIPAGVTVTITNQTVNVKGPKGEMKVNIHRIIKPEVKDNTILLVRTGETREEKSLHGLSRTLVANLVEGVTKGFEKKLEIQGVGFKAQTSGAKLTLNVGYSHPVDYIAPKGITFAIDAEKKNIISISGIDKQLVGEVAAKIRAIKKPEPYKGKGIRYLGEYVQKKAGKTAATGGKA